MNTQPGKIESLLLSKKSIPLRILILLAWLAIGAFGGMLQGQMSDVQENDQAAFLPESAESTTVTAWEEKFKDSAEFPAFVVFTKSDGSAIDGPVIGQLNEAAEGIAGAEMPDGSSLGDYLAVPSSAAIPSENGGAVMWPILLDGNQTRDVDSEGTQIGSATIDAIRTYANGVADDLGLNAQTTGPAALASDLSNAFLGIDLVLLLVAVVLVFVILIFVYRSIIIPIAVLTTAIFALCGAGMVVYYLAKASILDLDAQTQGILSILVIGATTDYCLLLVARYKEELTRQKSPYKAMAASLAGTWEPIAASAATVITGLLCLLLSDLSSTASLGPVAVIGIIFSVLAAFTLLPGIILVFGKRSRIMFWPSQPATPDGEEDMKRELPTHEILSTHGIWGKAATLVARNARKVWAITAVVLLAFAAFAPTFKTGGTSDTDTILGDSEAVAGFDTLYDAFPSITSAEPVTIIAPADKVDEITADLMDVDGVLGIEPEVDESEQPIVVDDHVLLNATIDAPAEDIRAQDTVKDMREVLDGTGSLVGGSAAERLDTQQTGRADLLKIVPVVLIVIAIMLMVLLRSIVAPLLVLLANILSFGATMGLAALLFNHVLGYPGSDASVPLYAFIFLVALSIDYTIFLMSRTRDEAKEFGTRIGTVRAVAVTGGVITSAGLVLAATFAALAVIPLLFMLQLAIIVALGILIDTFIVRTFLVPGLIHDIGKPVWWPWKNAIRDDELDEEREFTGDHSGTGKHSEKIEA